MSDTPTIVLNPSAAAPLRHALYSQLEMSIGALDTNLEDRKRTAHPGVWAAYMQIGLTGLVIDRIGWTDSDHRREIELVSPVEIKIAIHALRNELAVLEHEAPEDPRTTATRQMLKEIEATPAAAGLLDLEQAGFATQPDA